MIKSYKCLFDYQTELLTCFKIKQVMSLNELNNNHQDRNKLKEIF